MPRKTFVTGTVLTASDVNDYLMNQTVMVFASAAARNTAITSPIEGMIAYLSDSNTLTVYDGASWLGAVNAGSIQNNAVTADAIANNAVTATKMAADAISTPAIQNNAVSPAKLQSGMFGVTFADVSINTGTFVNWYMFTLPAGKLFSDVVSIIPYGGVNDIVYMFGVALGNWSGVQGPTQAQAYIGLGNGVASPFSTIRIYYRA